MSGEVLINLTPMETRVALVENGVLQEALIERSRRRGIVGNIYKGKVVRVLPGMQAAFVDIGLERAAFIHAHEVTPSGTPNEEQSTIGQLLHEGQALVVQVTKDPIGSKGARLTTHLSVPSRYLVYMPDSPHHGVSQRIEDERERERLKVALEAGIAQQSIEVTGGFIVRTAAEGVSEEEIASDMYFLLRLWRKVSQRKENAAPSSVIYDDLPLFMRTLRDVMRDDIEKVRIDSRENFTRLVEFAEEFMPDAVERIEYYPGERPIFDLYSVEDEIQKALRGRVVGYPYWGLDFARHAQVGGTSHRWFLGLADGGMGGRFRPLDPIDQAAERVGIGRVRVALQLVGRQPVGDAGGVFGLEERAQERQGDLSLARGVLGRIEERIE